MFIAPTPADEHEQDDRERQGNKSGQPEAVASCDLPSLCGMPRVAFDLQLLCLARWFYSPDVLQFPGLRAIDEFCQLGGRYEPPGHGVLSRPSNHYSRLRANHWIRQAGNQPQHISAPIGPGGQEPYDHLVMTKQRLGDLLVNSITHGLGSLLAVTGAVCLMVASARGTPRVIIACAVYASTLIFDYLCSTLYHSLVRTRARHVLRVLDHSAIYLLIAGTYTPFTLVSLRGPWGWTLFGIVWALAIAGVIFKSFAIERFAVASAVAYILMGWIAIVAIAPLARAITWHGIIWIGAGGIFYTFGILFFAFDRLRYFHAIWHVFVLAGSSAHFFAVASQVN